MADDERTPAGRGPTAAGGERTPAEREAARLAREKRRAQRARGPVSERLAASDGEPGITEADESGITEADESGITEADEPGIPGADQAGDYAFDEFDEFDEERELPSGTRRVSHFERSAQRGRRRRTANRRTRPVRRRIPASARPRHLWVGRAASLLALIVAGALAWFLIELFQPFHGSPHGQVTVVIQPDQSSSQIGNQLAKQGVIPSGFFFELRATLAGDRGRLRAGVYHLQLGMTYSAVLTALTKAPKAAKVTQLTIIEGRTRHEVAALLRAQGVRGNYLAATRSSPLLDYSRYGLRHKPSTLEGFLFPDTYQLVQPVKVQALVTDQLRSFKKNFAKVNLKYARRRHLTPYDVLIIASLIEGEAATAHDRPLVASVIYNRLADHMPLGLDSTTRFATGNYTRPLTESQLRSRSPYNTRVHAGLPPGPIDSPGLAAIQAAAHPAHTRYLYFFTPKCGGKAVYASSYARFLAQGSQDANRHC